MAKRKTAGRKAAVKKATKTAGRKKASASKASPSKASARKAAAGKASKKSGRGPAAAKKARSKKAVAKKAAPRKPPSKAPARKAPTKKALAKKPAAKPAQKKVAGRKITSRRPTPILKKPARAVAPMAGKAAPKKAATKMKISSRPGRVARPAPLRGSIPSSLGSTGGSSAARSGREEMLQQLKEHNETSPAITAGDVDADWQLAYSSGDEAPGGDNPTPDQDVVDEIGEALGVNYEDGEELKGAAKIEERDKHRWELDPASKDDFEDS